MPDSPPPDYQTAIKSRAPRVGDHVISHHFRHAYYTATILSFNKDDMSYHIQWDDGDPSGRNPKYNQVERWNMSCLRSGLSIYDWEMMTEVIVKNSYNFAGLNLQQEFIPHHHP